MLLPLLLLVVALRQVASSTNIIIIGDEDLDHDVENTTTTTTTTNTTHYKRTSKTVEFQYWLQTVSPTTGQTEDDVGDETVTLMQELLTLRSQRALEEGFAERDLTYHRNITIDNVTSEIVGPCEADFFRVGQQCVIATSEVTLSFLVPHDDSHTLEDNKNDAQFLRLLQEATINEVETFLESTNNFNPDIRVQLRSPIVVSTTLNLLFHHVATPLGEAEEVIVYKAFYNDYQDALADHVEPLFELSNVEVVLNAMVDNDIDDNINSNIDNNNNQPGRRLHLRTNQYHVHPTSLRVDLFVQATCQGLLCNEENFHQTLFAMVERTRKTFVQTLQRKGHFSTTHNDYFDDLSLITVYEFTIPPVSDDDAMLHYKHQPQWNFETPWSFWIAVILLMLLFVAASLTLVVVAKRQQRQQSITSNKNPSTPTKKKEQIKKSPSPLKRFNKVAPVLDFEEEKEEEVATSPSPPRFVPGSPKKALYKKNGASYPTIERGSSVDVSLSSLSSCSSLTNSSKKPTAVHTREAPTTTTNADKRSTSPKKMSSSDANDSATKEENQRPESPAIVFQTPSIFSSSSNTTIIET